jgi:hypothetical protein
MKTSRRSVIGFCLAMAATSAQADTWVPLAQEWVGMQGDHLGSSIAVRSVPDGDGHRITRVYVGSPDKTVGTFAGAGAVDVYVPGGQGWDHAVTLASPVPQAGAHFGASIAYSAGHLVVGSPDYNDAGGIGAGSGRVDFFLDEGATPVAITSQGFKTSTGGNLGGAVTVDGDMAAAGKVNAVGGGGCVSAWHYNVNVHAWQNLPAVDDIVCGSGGAALGASVAIRQLDETGYLLVAGAPGESQGGNLLAGGAHVYFPNPNTATGGLLEVGTLVAQAPGAFDFFGTSVGIDGSFIYVGGTGRDNGAGRVGSVTMFKPAAVFGWEYLAEYFPSAPATVGGLCGASLTVDADDQQFIMGCPNSTGSVAHEGTARVYRQFEFLGQPVWLDSVLGFGSQPHGGDALGSSVAISGDHAFVGAPDVNFPPPQTGNGGWKAFVKDLIFEDGFD